MNHRRHWNNEPYIMYVAWINTIILGRRTAGTKYRQLCRKFQQLQSEKEYEIQRVDCSHYLQQHLPQSHQTLCYLLERTTSLDSDQECVTRHCPSSATSTLQRVSTALFRSWISPNSLVSFRSGCVWPLTLIQLFHLCPSRLLSPSSWRNDNTQQWSLYSPTFFFLNQKCSTLLTAGTGRQVPLRNSTIYALLWLPSLQLT